MERIALAAKIHSGKKDAFRRALRMVWDDVSLYLDEQHISNFSVWEMADLLFVYGEAEDDTEMNAKKWENLQCVIGPVKEWITWLSTPDKPLQLMYHDYGIVRTSKELIRHRVFATKLKEGCLDEYKKRHDALIAKRGEQVNEGPESNYTIWSDGTYIFGYDEIDTTMETELTEEDRQQSVEWESKMLEIMDWITDDVDWLTNGRNAKSMCIARHK